MKRLLLIPILCLLSISIFAADIVTLNKEIKVAKDSTISATQRIVLSPGFKFTPLVQKGLYLKIQQIGTLTLTAKDAATNAALAGVTFGVKNSAGIVTNYKTATDGSIKITPLLYDTYTVTTVTPPTGYQTNSTAQTAKLENSVEKALSFVYVKKKIVTFHFDNSSYSGNPYYAKEGKDTLNAIRVGEHYWTDRNLSLTRDGGSLWLEGNTGSKFNPMTNEILKRYMPCIYIEQAKADLTDISAFNKYYGTYMQPSGIDWFGWDLVTVTEDGKTSKQWKLPSQSDANQLIAMCEFLKPETEILTELDVRSSLAPKVNANPVAFRIEGDSVKKLGQTDKVVYWFNSDFNKDLYGYNLMPNGWRLNGIFPWTNGLKNPKAEAEGRYISEFKGYNYWDGVTGDLALTYYTAYFPVTKEDASMSNQDPYRISGFVIIHDSIDYQQYATLSADGNYQWEKGHLKVNNKLSNRYSIRISRRLTDQELGYKLYVKVNDLTAWSKIKNSIEKKGEEPILRELMNKRITPAQVDIVQRSLTDPMPTDYLELPKGYIRGFYVQYFIQNGNKGKKVEDIVRYATKVQGNYLWSLVETPTSKSAVMTAPKQDITTTPRATVYPNPVKDILHIKSTTPVTAVKVYSMNGSLVISKKNLIDKQVDIKRLQHGTYIVKIWTDTKVETHRIIKK